MEAVVDGSAPGQPASRILLVDDDAAVRRAMGRALRQAGMSVVEAAGGDTAVELIAGSETFDMLVTDVRMLGRHGRGIGLAHAGAWPPRVVRFRV